MGCADRENALAFLEFAEGPDASDRVERDVLRFEDTAIERHLAGDQLGIGRISVLHDFDLRTILHHVTVGQQEMIGNRHR